MLFRSDSLVNAAEKAISQAPEGVITEEQKKEAEAATADLKAALEGTDIEAVKAKSEALENVIYPISEAIYRKASESAQTAQGDAGQTAQESTADDYVDADFEDEKKE